MNPRSSTLSPADNTFVLCVANDGYEVSLETRKIYERILDAAAPTGFMRVVDESGEDYLFPASLFSPISLPADLAKVVHDLGV